MLSTYLRLIDEQRAQNPKYPKDYRAKPLATRKITSAEVLDDLTRWSNSQFVGITERQTPLYPDINDNYYYEFVDVGIKSTTAFPDWRFFYIPISKYDDLIAQARDGILPSYKVYDVSTRSINTVLTKTQPVVPYTRPSSTFFTLPTTTNLHPLLPNFLFTGYSFLDKKGFMIYEYNDFKMFTDDITVTYYSKLRPLNFFLSSSITQGYGLELDTTSLALIDRPPFYLELYIGTPTLKFTGNTTTRAFNNCRKWYEYTRYIDGFPFDTILLPYAPTPFSIDFVRIEVNNRNMGLNFPQTVNTQSLSLNQVSSNNKISLL